MAGLAPSALFGLAFSAGAATFFAPCAFPLLPGYVGYYLGKTGDGTPDGPLSTRLGRAAVVGLLARVFHVRAFAPGS